MGCLYLLLLRGSRGRRGKGRGAERKSLPQIFCLEPRAVNAIVGGTDDGHDLTGLIVTLSMIGKFAMTAAFGTVVLFAQEIYPTNVRYRLLYTGTGFLHCMIVKNVDFEMKKKTLKTCFYTLIKMLTNMQ